ncbi:hypothetical protein DL771_002732 [Monosporascus sp. 5C6A]|nr:hypothetical protein DL771_002732 [Monosporascus sp. 5C6A]
MSKASGPSSRKYEPICALEDVENPENYEPGGFHPVNLFDVLGDRFQVIYKLGFGGIAMFTEGLSFLHQMGVAHGDFRPANILTRLDQNALDKIDVDEMKHLLDAPEMEYVLTIHGESSPHAPECVVTAVRWGRLQHLIIDEAAIVDFGEAYGIGDPPSYLGIPRAYAAPEVMFDGTPTTESDIWSLAHTLIEFRLGMSFITTISSIIWQMERFSGPLPNEYRETARKMLEESRGEPLQLPPDDSTRITEDFEKLNQMDKRNAEGTDFTDHLEITLGAEYLVKRTQPLEEDPDPDQSCPEEWKYGWQPQKL